MTVLTRDKILELIESRKLKIEPYCPELVKEHGIDLRVSGNYVYYNDDIHATDKTREISLNNNTINENAVYCVNQDFIRIPPKSCVILQTLEYIEMPNNVVGLCTIKSTLARAGLMTAPTVVDAGFRGNLTIILYNTRNCFVKIDKGTPFLYLLLLKCEGEVEYQGRYQQSVGLVLAKPLRPILSNVEVNV